MLMNNISEAFNGRILEARDKSILTMMEWIIRGYWLSLKVEGYKGNICPTPMKRLDGKVVRSKSRMAKWVGAMKFDVSDSSRHVSEKFILDLHCGSCSCRT